MTSLRRAQSSCWYHHTIQSVVFFFFFFGEPIHWPAIFGNATRRASPASAPRQKKDARRMSKVAARHNLLGLVDEDSEDDLVEENRPTANTARKRTASGAPTTTSMPPAKKRGGATAAATAKSRGGTANKITKPAAKTGPAARRRAGDQVAAALAEAEAEAAEAPAPRNPPARRGAAGRGRGGAARGRVIASTQQDDSPEAGEEHDETGGAEASVLSPPDSDTLQTTARRARGRPRAGAAAASGTKRPATRDAPEPVEEAPPEPAPAPARRGRKPAAGTKAKAAAAAAPEMEDVTLEIPETQQPREDTMDVDVAEDDFTGPLIGDELTEISPLRSPPGPAIRHRSISPTKARSTMDLDESDSSLRRRLGELTRKHDALEAKYRDLREIGVKEAEKTFERFKKQTEERDKGW